jgi:diacylglycerol O-acyltransferase / wax synthase
MDRLSPLDSLFLHVEDGVTHMHIGSCAIFEGPAPPYEKVLKLVERKLPRLPRYRQKVRFVPGELGRPLWIDDCHFNLAYHVRHSALPPPGGPDELNALMGRLMAVELDRHRPLWEVWMIEGLTGGRWAVISKVHHCMVDGISGTDLMVVFLDPTDPPSIGSDGWTPAPEPSAIDLAVGGVLELLRTPAEQVRAVRAMLRGPRRALAEARAALDGAIALGRNLQPTPALSIEGAIGPHRRWASAAASLDDLKAIRSALGGTVNDVILSVLSGAFRDLMVSRGDPVDGSLLRTLVPVSIRAPGDRTANNQVSVIIAELPVGVADPVERLAATRRQMDTLKGSHQAEAGEVATTLAGFVPPTLYALALRSASAALRRFPQQSVHTVTTNVPGPREPLSALGREMVEYLPFVPLSQGTRIGVAILSYNGQVRFGVTGDYDTIPEVDWFCARIETGVAELLSRSGVRRGRHAKASTGARVGRGRSRPLTTVPTHT